MQVTRADLSTELKKVEIITIADAHLGDPCADEKNLREKIRHIKETPEAFCIINGDLLNNATKASVSDTYAEVLSPMEQLSLATSLLVPIADKIIAVTSGNHEARTYKQDGIDLLRLVCRQLGIEEKYSPAAAYVFLRFGHLTQHSHPASYTIFINHGTGGGRKDGGKVNRLVDMASIIDADIYIHSHTHTPIIVKKLYYRTNAQNSRVNPIERLFVNTGGLPRLWRVWRSARVHAKQ